MFRCLGAKRTLVDMRKKREQSNLIFCLDVGTVEPPFCENKLCHKFWWSWIIYGLYRYCHFERGSHYIRGSFGPNSLKLSIGDENIGSLQKASRPGFFVVVFFPKCGQLQWGVDSVVIIWSWKCIRLIYSHCV